MSSIFTPEQIDTLLVTTARQLFSQFYQGLVCGEGIGEALDNARIDLYANEERGEKQRGEKRITLKLQDWFLPALYQAGRDTPLLKEIPPTPLEKGGNTSPPLLSYALVTSFLTIEKADAIWVWWGGLNIA